jgi:release factor glutamine methyltransferase
MSIDCWLRTNKLARLDAELLLAFVLKRPREWVLAHGEYELSPAELARLNELCARRKNHEPLAYIVGKKEFYGRDFTVTPDVLIPRPETEQIVEVVKNYVYKSDGSEEKIVSLNPVTKILDVGTGSGAIAITLALELPHAAVTASDISPAALKVACANAEKLNVKINLVQSDLLKNITEQFDIIVANLPYVDRSWQVSPDTKYEPESALFAGDGGLELIKKLIDQAPNHLTNNAYLILELDPRQMSTAKTYAEQSGYTFVAESPYALALRYQGAN